ncbi:MAG: hypothetical protein QNL68_20430 [Akkermansiaceae bacterium]
MIENIRKYTGLMIVVLVLLFVGLVFLGDNVGNTFAGKPVMEVAGRGVSQKEFQRNAIDVQKIAMEIPNRTPLPRETRILASHYLDEDIIENPYVLAGSILQQMGMFLQPSDGLPERFLANRLAVQKAGIEYGVTPSDNEVESFVENVLFADEDGNFNQEASREFFDETAGKLGIGTRGFNEYIRDLMTTQNLSKLIGGGIPPEMETVRALYDSAKQSISVKQISLDSATFEAEVNPTEEEIKAFYEENKDKYNSEEQRKISYVFVEPDWATKLDEVTAAKAEAAKKAEEERLKMEADKKLAEEAAARANEAKDSEEKPETPDSTDAPAPTDTTESSETSEEGPQGQTGEPGEPAPAEEPAAPAEEPTAPAEEPAAPAEEPAAPAEEPAAPAEEPAAPVATISQEPKDKLNGAEKKEAVDALNPELTEFYQDIVDKMGADFEGLAAKHNFKVVTTELFTKEDAPELFKTLISNAAIGAIADAAFQLPEEADLDEKITPPYQTNDGWFVGRLEEIVKSVPLTYEQAKVRVTVDLKKKLARELMAKKAKELQEKLATAVKDGKSFEEVAKEEGHTASTLPDLKGGQSFQGRQFPAPPAFQAAQFTTPGEVAPVKLTPSEENPDRAIIVLVEKREVTKDEEYNTGLEGAFKGQSNITRYVAFQNWLYDRYNANDVKLFRSE